MATVISFERDALVSGLAIAGLVSPWSRDARTPGMVRIVASSGTATLSCSAAEAYVEAEIPCGDGLAGFTLPLGVLTALVKKAPQGARIDLEVSAGATIVRTGRLRSKLVGAESDTLPGRPAPVAAEETVSADALRLGIEATTPAATNDMKQPVLGGIHLHSAAGHLAFAAQDGARIHASAQDGARIHASALIPRHAAGIILRALPDQGNVAISADARSVMLRALGVRVIASLLVGPFPSIDQQMASPTNREFRARADQLLADLDLVMTVGSIKDRDFRLDLGPTCEASAFRVGDGGAAAGAVRLEGTFSGAPIAIGFQFHLVRDALRLFGADVVHWRMGGPQEPSLITSPSRPGVEAMVSPFILAPDHLRRSA